MQLFSKIALGSAGENAQLRLRGSAVVSCLSQIFQSRNIKADGLFNPYLQVCANSKQHPGRSKAWTRFLYSFGILLNTWPRTMSHPIPTPDLAWHISAPWLCKWGIEVQNTLDDSYRVSTAVADRLQTRRLQDPGCLRPSEKYRVTWRVFETRQRDLCFGQNASGGSSSSVAYVKDSFWISCFP